MHFLANVTLYTILSMIFLAPVSVTATNAAVDYHLAISFDMEAGKLIGTAKIRVQEKEKLSLYTGSQQITGVVIQSDDGGSHEASLPEGNVLTLAPAATGRELLISYTVEVLRPGTNLISKNGITLLEDWHPLPDRNMTYRLDAMLPQGFSAICESDAFPLERNGNMVSATFSETVSSLHFAAAPYLNSTLDVREGLKVYTLFFPEEAQLAASYLGKAKDYLLRYESEIGPFPYNHYVIAANRLPTGLGMPTFTLLGQSVLRLPFIKDTSLGHEILHSWFGNSIDINISGGNWCEGLTSYLADHAYRQDLGEGAQYRKEAIINYLSYVHSNNTQPLSNFTSASHDQLLARPLRAIGYSRAMMLFHELRKQIGEEAFTASLRKFYSTFKGETASWNDIRLIFSETSGQDLTLFFSQRLSRTDIPDLTAADIKIFSTDSATKLQFTLSQNSEDPYSLLVPILVSTGQGEFSFVRQIDTLNTEISLEIPGRPFSVTLDPEYTLFRKLDYDEYPPVWSRFMGSSHKLVVLEPGTTELFSPLLSRFEQEDWNIVDGQKVTNSQLRDADLLILGSDQKAARTLFASPAHPDKGFTLDVRNNPLNPGRVAVLISSSSPRETSTVAARLRHYGKYSYLHFQGGRAIERNVRPSTSGKIYQLEQLPSGVSTAQLSSFSHIVRELRNNDVIYIGESHDAVSDHRLQFRIIEALAEQHPNLAIGMEMFPATSQAALDEYILGDGTMSEKEFLKASRYFDVWRYDFRFFRDIFAFAKKQKIPVIGLNLERSIVSSVYRSGTTDELSDEIRKTLPRERDLDLPGYASRLRFMHSAHQAGNHGSGIESGFIQAQSLWDETMAENIATYLSENPGRKMIILAGSQHTRKDSGIPPRVARRLDVEQVSVLNILNGSTPDNVKEIADYFFLVPPQQLEPAPKLGIVLQEISEDNRQHVRISEFSPESNGDEAGMEMGDILLAIEGYSIATMADVRIAMLDVRMDKKIEVTVSRIENGQQVNKSYLVQPIDKIELR